jgi:hypothetical protein
MILGITASGFAGKILVADDFNRADGALGVTSTNSLPWQTLSGTFAISNNKVWSPAYQATSGLAVIDNSASDADLSLEVAPEGGDALYFRVQDSTNWWRTHIRGVTEVVYYSTGYYRYQWGNYYSGAEYYPSGGGTCQQTYHDHGQTITYNWSTSSSTNTAPTNTTYSHTHSITVYGCNQTVTFTHSHVAQTYYTGTTEFVVTGTGAYNQTTRTLVLSKSVNNVVTEVGTYIRSSITSIQASINGTSITVKVNNEATALISTTSSDLLNATRHGIGRGPTTDHGTAMDNFSVTPIGV